MTNRAIKLAVIHDMPEEGWLSMDQMGALIATRVPLQSIHIQSLRFDKQLMNNLNTYG